MSYKQDNRKHGSYPNDRKHDSYNSDRKRDQKYDKKQDHKVDDTIIDNKLLYDKLVDTCEIKYATWALLQVRELVDIKKYEHLKLVPYNLLKSTDFITKVLWTAIKH